ncbi:MAG: aminotransferase class I/II-fold pyridoxal phosphate-dependent enzyme, partial [Rhodospirillaceae bacterium]|nr:aminotransferase class I/II-fold pyridoxal phosphate-dependent enzyme [Rhodospirillaceae bacterium]
ELENLRRFELEEVRLELVRNRAMLRKMLESEIEGFDASFIERQLGMFSCLPISADEQRLMEDLFHIYMLPNARVNVAAMKSSDARTVAGAFRELRNRRTGEGLRRVGEAVG